MVEIDPTNYKMKENKRIKLPVASKSMYRPNLTDDDLRKLAREKLSEALQVVDPASQPELTRKLCAELMDRLDGKPSQVITQNIHNRLTFFDQRAVEILGAKPVKVIDHESK
jgi:hypothetical protein